MKLSELAEGVVILRRYYENGDGYHVRAKRDAIYLYATSSPVSAEDVAKLLALGWFQSNGATVDVPSGYSQEEPWVHFT